MLCSLQSKVKSFREVLSSWNIRPWSKLRPIWVRISVGEHCYIWYHNINWFPSKVVVGTCENCVLGTETCVNNVAFYQDLRCFQFPLSPFLKVHVNAGTKYPTDLATSFGCNICFAWSCNYKWDFCKKKTSSSLFANNSYCRRIDNGNSLKVKYFWEIQVLKLIAAIEIS